MFPSEGYGDDGPTRYHLKNGMWAFEDGTELSWRGPADERPDDDHVGFMASDGDLLELSPKGECAHLRCEWVHVDGLEYGIQLYGDGSMTVECQDMSGRAMEKFCKRVLRKRGWTF